jgi:hypothetical protein
MKTSQKHRRTALLSINHAREQRKMNRGRLCHSRALIAPSAGDSSASRKAAAARPFRPNWRNIGARNLCMVMWA